MMVLNDIGPTLCRKVVVVGAGGFARETLDVIDDLAELSVPPLAVVGVTDPSPQPMQLERLRRRGVQYVGTDDEFLQNFEVEYFVAAIGSPEVRKSVAEKYIRAGLKPLTLIHPTAIVGRHTSISEGVIICAGAVISTNVRIGRFVTINPNATIGHDAILEEFASINPGSIISGEVMIGKQVLVGAGAVVLENLRIGERATVGASACVTRDVGHDMIVTGVPARPFNR